MQRTENEFDAERRILEASGTRDMASLVPRILSNPPYGESKLNSWVARDVTKNQTKKLSILLSFYFHEVLQYLNTFT